MAQGVRELFNFTIDFDGDQSQATVGGRTIPAYTRPAGATALSTGIAGTITGYTPPQPVFDFYNNDNAFFSKKYENGMSPIEWSFSTKYHSGDWLRILNKRVRVTVNQALTGTGTGTDVLTWEGDRYKYYAKIERIEEPEKTQRGREQNALTVHMTIERMSVYAIDTNDGTDGDLKFRLDTDNSHPVYQTGPNAADDQLSSYRKILGLI